VGRDVAVTDALAQRRAERDRLIDVARAYAETLGRRLAIEAVVLAGSVARGDFNLWSDIDVIVVADGLPARLPDRLALLTVDAPSGVQPAGFTPAELRRAAQRANRLVLDAAEHGIVLAGDPLALTRACESAAAADRARESPPGLA
jgi:predicted nucleotidyltransferase